MTSKITLHRGDVRLEVRRREFDHGELRVCLINAPFGGWAIASIEQCRISNGDAATQATFWIGSVAFDITADEAASVIAAFGIRDTREVAA